MKQEGKIDTTQIDTLGNPWSKKLYKSWGVGDNEEGQAVDLQGGCSIHAEMWSA